MDDWMSQHCRTGFCTELERSDSADLLQKQLVLLRAGPVWQAWTCAGLTAGYLSYVSCCPEPISLPLNIDMCTMARHSVPMSGFPG